MTGGPVDSARSEPPRFRSPFKGLASFQVEDAPLFFGRKAERRLCVANLKANRLTVLYAPSGVGKTSLLAAGVVPDVRNGAFREGDPVPGQAIVLLNTWTDDPLARLESLIDNAMRAASAPPGPSTEPGIETRLLQWSTWMRGPALIVLDQFERLYTGRRLSPATIDHFVEKLGALLQRADLPVNVLLAVREDSLSVLDHLGDYVPEAKRNWLSLGELTETGAAEAINGPIAWWRKNRPEEPCPEIEDGFVESVLAACVSRKRGSHKTTARLRYDAPLLQMMLKRRWDEALRSESKLVAVPFSETNRDEVLRAVVNARLLDVPGGLHKTAAIVFTHLISATGRPVPQSCDELVKRGGRKGESLNPDSVQKVLDLLSAGERDIRILQELPGDPDPLYTILQDFLVKPVLTWATDWINDDERYLRESIWPKIREQLPVILAILLGFGALSFAWLWKNADLHDKAVHLFPHQLNLDSRKNPGMLAADRNHPRNAVLVAVPDGALYWSQDYDEVVNLAQAARLELKHSFSPPAPEEEQRAGTAPGGNIDIVSGPITVRGWALMREPSFQQVVGYTSDNNTNWVVCRLIPGESYSCDPLKDARHVGISAGGRSVFSYREDGLFTFYDRDPKTLELNSRTVRVGMTWRADSLISAAAMCDPAGVGNSVGIAALENVGVNQSRVYLFACNGDPVGKSFDVTGTAIALLPTKPGTIWKWISGHKLRIAIGNSSGIQTYSLNGERLDDYPHDDDERLIQFLWPVLR